MLKPARELSPAKQIAYAAVTCAMLIGVQLALYAVPGVELVTVLLLSTSYVFGARFGFLTGLSFSLIRCILFGVYLSVIILYCLYFPLFGVIFGLMGKRRNLPISCAVKILLNVVLIALGVAAMCAAWFNLIKVARAYKKTTDALLWALGAIFILTAVAFDAVWATSRKNDRQRTLKLFLIATAAAVCTICFTLIDDVVTPLVLGMSQRAALGYFYASFTAMLPQTVCTIVSVSLLFYPLTAVLRRIKQ